MQKKRESLIYRFPSIDLLSKDNHISVSREELKDKAVTLIRVLESFGIHVTIIGISIGAQATRFELQVELGVKLSKVTNLLDDIRMWLSEPNIRIIAPIPGKTSIAVDIPNRRKGIVRLRTLLESEQFQKLQSVLAFAVGKDIGGNTIVVDLAKMPHILIAGTTGSGKSVCIDSIIMSILYKAHPYDVNLILIDSKSATLGVYNGIPHLLIPVITDVRKSVAALRWAIAETFDRCMKFADLGVKNLKDYNKKIECLTPIENYYKLANILIVIDDLSDLMAINKKEVEESIAKLAQTSRAVGIHLIISTQRPSRDVVTGMIKSNIPSRIAFSVFSAIDSRTILNEKGAEGLLGNGDMLFKPQGYPSPMHIQGAFISNEEICRVVEFLKVQMPRIEETQEGTKSPKDAEPAHMDEFLSEAGRFVIKNNKASIGMLQRHFKIGFNRAARIMDELCDCGVVGEENGTKPREILMTIREFEEYIKNNL